MKKPDNRMLAPEDRMPQVSTEPTKDPIKHKADNDDVPTGIACKYCKTVANHPVRRTYPNKMRLRFCRCCRREFQTWESIV